MERLKVLLAFGTRPEGIKLAPVIREMMNRPDDFQVSVCDTGQHKEMLAPILRFFDIKPDYNLEIMSHNQTLSNVCSSIIKELDKVLDKDKPDIMVVQGDTATTLSAALVSYFRKIPIAYVEAGLRTGDIFSPFPEEANRKMVSAVSNWQFAPTELSAEALLGEGYKSNNIHIVGNTAIDAIKIAEGLLDLEGISVPDQFNFLSDDKKMVLITGHRRENFGEIMDGIVTAFAELARENPEVHFIYPVHLNPNVQKVVKERLQRISNFHLFSPQPYDLFVWLMMRSYIIITDSGGIQEEAPSLNKPVIVTRSTTERMEAIDAGACELAGTNGKDIICHVNRLLVDSDRYKEMAKAVNPFGDGKTAVRICDILLQDKDKLKNG